MSAKAKIASTALRISGDERKDSVSGTRSKGSPRRIKAAFELAPHRLEFIGRGALEGEDRLLLVAHGKERAASRGLLLLRKFSGERSQYFPLLAARVLRFVEQYMADLMIELIEDPGRVGALQQIARSDDEIVEIQEAARELEFLESGDDLAAKLRQRHGTLECASGFSLLEPRYETVAFGLHQLQELGIALVESLGDDLRLADAARLQSSV